MSRRRSSWHGATLTLCAITLLTPRTVAAEEEPAVPADVEVALLQPTGEEPVFGEGTVDVGIYPPNADIDRIEVFLDEAFVGSATEDPWEVSVDFGERNTGHDVLIVVHGRDGWQIERSVTTPSIYTHEEVNIQLQQLYVTVERDGEAVLNLEREDFRVVDGNAAQRLVTFERGDVPFTAILLVDASISMRGRSLETAIRGAKTFAESMNPLDEAKLILFSDRTIYETPFTSFSSVLSLGLGGTRAGGWTALNDYLYLALKRLEERQGRRVIILLSDGFDVNSVLSIEQVREIARLNPTVVHWVYLRDPKNEDARMRSFWRTLKDQAREAELLRETVLETGGRIMPIDGVDGVGEAFAEVLRELRDQYVLGYYPPSGRRPGQWYDIRVDVDTPNAEVRTRSGYRASPE